MCRCILLFGFLSLSVLCVSVCGFGLFSRPSHATRETMRPLRRPKHGSLKLCPPGGASFLDAVNLVCPMKRRRRSVSMRDPFESPAHNSHTQQQQGALNSQLGRTMHMCCATGCEFSDIFAICNPFG